MEWTVHTHYYPDGPKVVNDFYFNGDMAVGFGWGSSLAKKLKSKADEHVRALEENPDLKELKSIVTLEDGN